MNIKGIAPIIMIVAVLAMMLGGVTLVYSLQYKGNSQSNLEEIPLLDAVKSPEKTDESSSTILDSVLGSFKAKIVGGYYSYPLSGEVIMTGQGITKSTKSSSDGWFTIAELPVGKYKINITHPEYNFSEFEVEVAEGENIFDRSLNGFLKNFQPLKITGQTYKDVNSNGSKDNGEGGIDIFFILYIKNNTDWNQVTTVQTDDNGNFSFQQEQPGVYKLEPVYATNYSKPDPVEFTVDGYGGSKNYLFGYKALVSQDGIEIFVFNDINENSIKDDSEGYIHYQSARITNLSGTSTRPDGNTWMVAVSDDGYSESPLDWGEYKVELEPQDSSWDFYYKITKREQTVSVNPQSGKQRVELGAHKLY